MQHTVTFTHNDKQASVETPTGTLLSDAARLAGIDIGQPCGGQGRCGRCAVQVTEGSVRRRSTLRLSPIDIEEGYALACQTVVEGEAAIYVPPQEKIERRLTTDRVVAEVTVPVDYEYPFAQTVRRVHLTLTQPSMDDQTDDWSRLQTAFRLQHQVEHVTCSVSLLRKMGDILRDGDWRVTAIIETSRLQDEKTSRLIDLHAGHEDEYAPLWGCAMLVLQGADGVVFVADSQARRFDENLESLRDLQDSLLEQGVDAREFPLVFQYNKQDLPGELALAPSALDEALNFRGVPSFPADALRGGGVFETLRAVTTLVLQRLAQRPHAP